jgi:D-alanine-D-alanine ligase-like ATP-grasp enzyme
MTGSTQDYQAFVAEVDSYITRNIGYPCFLKPNAQSQGEGVHKCLDIEDVGFVLRENQRNRLLDNPHNSLQLFLVEETITWPDYRVVVFKNKVVACYRRIPLFVVGDGISTIQELLQQKQAEFSKAGRAKLFNAHDPRIVRRLQKMQIDVETVLPAGQLYHLHDISNLCVGGEVEDYTERICDYWRAFCIRLVADMGLRLCGVDLACADLEQPGSPYSILELNAVPGLSNFASIGAKQARTVRALYQQVFSEDDF